MDIAIIVAKSSNHVIGVEGNLPWHLPRDLKFFKNTTKGHPIIMGRKTYESIGKPLPYRTNIIITQNTSFQAEGCLIAHSIEEAIQLANEHEKEVSFIIGGGKIYQQALLLAKRLYITEVDTTIEHGDTFFPTIDMNLWKETARERFEKDEKNNFDCDFVTYTKV